MTGAVLDVLLVALALLATVAWAGRRRAIVFVVRQAENAAAARDHASAALWLRVARWMGALDPMLLVERAWHLARMGRREDALRAYRRAARALPREVGDAEYGAARVLAELGELDEAEDMLEAAIARDPTVLEDVRRDEDLGVLLAGRPRFEAWRR